MGRDLYGEVRIVDADTLDREKFDLLLKLELARIHSEMTELFEGGPDARIE